jgi:hypothetical protein
MKKFSKRLTMIVAILLCLVLITSSAVSTTLAKYVITKTASTKVSFAKFGVTVTLDSADMTKDTEKLNGDSVEVSYTATLKPHATQTKSIRASVTGTPSVDSTVTIDVTVEYVGSFNIPAADFTATGADAVTPGDYIPLGFKVGGSSNYATDGTYTASPYSNNTAAQTESAIENAIAGISDKLTYSKTDTTTTISGTFTTANGEIGLNDMGIVLNWPFTYDGVANSDEIGTYLATKSTTPSVKITYKISVVQS